MTSSSNPASITIGFVGDVFLGRAVWDLVQRRGPRAPFAAMLPLLEQFDLTVGNFELCLSDGAFEEVRGRLVVPHDQAETLKHSGIEIFSLANNHIMDFGARGLQATASFLRENGFRFFGAGSDLAEAEKPLILTCKGKRIAFLGACDASLFYADRSRPGIAPLMQRRLVRRVIAAKQIADIVIVILHADLEFVSHPAPFRQRLSRRLIDLGATMVIQHHPHVVQGLEAYKDGLIAYSLGNYVFPVKGNSYQERRPGTSDSMLLAVTLNIHGDDVRIEMDPIPLRIDDDGCPVPCDATEAEQRNHALKRLSEETSHPALVRRSRFTSCKSEAKSAFMGVYYALARKDAGGAQAQLKGLLTRPENWRWMAGLLSGGRY
ncbi:CapA family protein [Rhodospirillaceae bacterium SYSU D60014]|uniref:CapA family protein n=1 Tax=Virgifigura deserti TaxID=2268457 RepID=UPI000E66E371